MRNWLSLHYYYYCIFSVTLFIPAHFLLRMKIKIKNYNLSLCFIFALVLSLRLANFKIVAFRPTNGRTNGRNEKQINSLFVGENVVVNVSINLN